MNEKTVSLAEAKAHLSELAELARGGEDVVITKRGRPVMRLSRVDSPRQPVNVKCLRALTARLAVQSADSESLICLVRDDSCY